MTNEPTMYQTDAASHAWQQPESAFDAEGPLAEITWWLTGGLALLAWTGIVLVLTGS